MQTTRPAAFAARSERIASRIPAHVPRGSLELLAGSRDGAIEAIPLL